MAARYRFCREYVDKETPSMSVDIPTFMLGVFIYEHFLYSRQLSASYRMYLFER